MKAALYTRVSTDEQVEKGFSLDAQKKRLMEYCLQNNYEIYKLYTDEGISGHSITKRKSLQELIRDAKAKKFDCVIVYKTDRLSRNLLDLLTIKKELDEADVELIMSDESVDTSDDTGMAMFSIMGAFAELERKKICERLMSGKRQKMLSTGIKPKQGVIPYGYIYDDINKKYVVDERYRNDIIKVYELFISGKSFNYIAQYMAKNNLNFGRAKTNWHASDVPRIIRNPIYKGWTGMSYYNTVHYSFKCDNETLLVKATNVEPIVSEEMWEKAKQIDAVKTKYFSRKHPTDKFVFAGLLYCNNCGYAILTNQSKERKLRTTGEFVKYYYYECNSRYKLYNNEEKCKGFNINTDKFDKMFIDFINNMKSGSSFVKNYNTNELKSLRRKKDTINSQLLAKSTQKEVLLEKLISGTITDDDYKLMSNKVSSDVKRLEEELQIVTESIAKYADGISYEEQIGGFVKALKALVKMWYKVDNAEKKRLLNSFIRKIYVSKEGISKIEFK